mmetsp:Transcript_54/g.147  ORF Transcript_54/g.147 Transcript_54/m.147 type:complete len:426 (-) Transcript_54:274-1551(-)
MLDVAGMVRLQRIRGVHRLRAFDRHRRWLCAVVAGRISAKHRIKIGRTQQPVDMQMRLDEMDLQKRNAHCLREEAAPVVGRVNPLAVAIIDDLGGAVSSVIAVLELLRLETEELGEIRLELIVQDGSQNVQVLPHVQSRFEQRLLVRCQIVIPIQLQRFPPFLIYHVVQLELDQTQPELFEADLPQRHVGHVVHSRCGDSGAIAVAVNIAAAAVNLRRSHPGRGSLYPLDNAPRRPCVGAIQWQKDVLAQQEIVDVLLVLRMDVIEQVGRIRRQGRQHMVVACPFKCGNQVIVQLRTELVADQVHDLRVRVLQAEIGGLGGRKDDLHGALQQIAAGLLVVVGRQLRRSAEWLDHNLLGSCGSALLHQCLGSRHGDGLLSFRLFAASFSTLRLKVLLVCHGRFAAACVCGRRDEMDNFQTVLNGAQ